MISKTLLYTNFLKMKLRILEDIHKNSTRQSGALERKDYDLLEELLKSQQGHIERLEKIMGCFKEYNGMEVNEETEELKRSINFFAQEIISTNNTNLKGAENQKNDIAGAIRNIKLGKHAIRDGYYKKIPQRYGYFIDKKVGKYT